MADSDVNENYKSNKPSEKPAERPPLDKHDLTAYPQSAKRALADTKMAPNTAEKFPAEEKLLAQLTEPNKAAIAKAGNSESTKAPEKKINPLEKDANEKIKRINYPDGSYRTIDYDIYGTPITVNQYNNNGKQTGAIETPNSATSPVQLKVNDNGAIEKNTRKVSSHPGEDIYDRQGNHIGSKSSYYIELLLQENWKPDGSHSLKREYPNGSVREFASKLGEPNTYTYKGPDGQKQIWTQEPRTSKWYKAEDTKHEKPWTGKEEFRPDGRFIRTAADGNIINEIASDGSEIAPDKNIWKQDVLAIAKEKITDPTALKQFEIDIEDIDKRIKPGQLSELEVAKTYQQIYRGLTTKSQVGVSDEHLMILDRDIAHEQGQDYPKPIQQGKWSNCFTAASDALLSYTESATVARLGLDAAITGKYTDTKGITVDISKSVQPSDEDALNTEFLPDCTYRSYASQLFDVVVHNLELADFNKKWQTNLEYVQGPADKEHNGAFIMDNNTSPPSKVYSLSPIPGSPDRLKPIHYSTPITDEAGVHQLDSNLQPMVTSPMERIDPCLDVCLSIAERLSGKSMSGRAIGHFDNVGTPDNWIYDKVGLAKHISINPKIPFFKTEADLEKILVEAKASNKVPIILQVDIAAGKIGEQYTTLFNMPLGGVNGHFGGGHVICISDYDPVTKTSFMEGPWNASCAIPKATFNDILAMSRQPEHLRKEQELFENNIKLAYKQWCKDNRKQWNTDFPTAADGREYLYQFRRMRKDQESTPKMNR